MLPWRILSLSGSLVKIGFAWVLLWFSSVAFATGLLQDMDGKTLSMADFKGKWVLINYWASWCHTCLDEIPELNRFYNSQKKNNVALFAVNYEALPLNQQAKLIKSFDIQYPSLSVDPAQELALGDIRGVPVTFVIDPTGRLVDALYGGQSMGQLKEVVKAG